MYIYTTRFAVKSVSCNLQTGSDFPQPVQTVKLGENQGKNHVVYSRVYTPCACIHVA